MLRQIKTLDEKSHEKFVIFNEWIYLLQKKIIFPEKVEVYAYKTIKRKEE